MRRAVGGLVATLVLGASDPAFAIPAFARKYHTSCETCHTVYPKLTPFGEAFRRNGFRFPGHDGDFVKEEPVSLGQDAFKDMFPHAVWPGTLPGGVPLAFGFDGSAVVHPDTSTGGATADNGARFTMADLIAEAHLWAGGSFDDTTTFFGEVTGSSDGVEVEHGEVHFNDLIGPPHLVNLTAGKAQPSLSSFGPHSTYLADTVRIVPDAGDAVSDLRLVPGASALLRPNLKLTLTVPIERASGAPSATWAPAARRSTSGSRAHSEQEEILCHYELGTWGKGVVRSHVFAQQGACTQVCKLHPEMLAFVFVGQNPYAAAVTPTGTTRSRTFPPERTTSRCGTRTSRARASG